MLIKCFLISLSVHTAKDTQKKNISFSEPNKPLNDHKDLILPNTTEDHLRWSVTVTVEVDADITEFNNAFNTNRIIYNDIKINWVIMDILTDENLPERALSEGDLDPLRIDHWFLMVFGLRKNFLLLCGGVGQPD